MIASFSFASTAHVTQWLNYLTQRAEILTRRSHLSPQRAKNTGMICLWCLWAFSIYKKFLKTSIGNSVSFRLGRERSICQSPIRLQAPLRRFTKKTDALVNCSAIFSNASLFVAFPSNKCLLSACVVMRSLTSACSRRSRFTVVETSPVNERTFQSCSCNILVSTRETCTGKESFEQARISTYHFYIRHIRTAINFHDLALERGRHSSRSSPEVCCKKLPET